MHKSNTCTEFCFEKERQVIYMEIMDIYDANGNRTGKTAVRRSPLPAGQYFLCVQLILETPEHLFLIQKRSDTKPTRPGQWDITAGAVDAGETSQHGILRETKEEIGLTLSQDQLEFWFRDRCRSTYHDIYHVQTKFTLDDCTMQPSEVQALRLVTANELWEIIEASNHRSTNYKEQMKKYLLHL